MTGFSISTSRAVIMMLLLFAADLLHRSYDLLSSLAISACIITLQNPYAVYSCSFLLSYFAVLGIAAILPALQMIIVGDSEKRRAKLRKKGVGYGKNSKVRYWINANVNSLFSWKKQHNRYWPVPPFN